jgi:hypothetical protein
LWPAVSDDRQKEWGAPRADRMRVLGVDELEVQSAIKGATQS